MIMHGINTPNYVAMCITQVTNKAISIKAFLQRNLKSRSDTNYYKS